MYRVSLHSFEVLNDVTPYTLLNLKIYIYLNLFINEIKKIKSVFYLSLASHWAFFKLIWSKIPHWVS